MLVSMQYAHEMLMDIPEELVPLLSGIMMIPTHLTVEERMFLFFAAMRLREGFVAAEIGSYRGASTAFMAAAASLRGGHVHAVDTWMNDNMTDAGRDVFASFLENTARFRSRISIHRGKAEDLVGEVPDRLDALFIDGDHSFEGTLSALELYAGKVKPDGLLLMHDFERPEIQAALSAYGLNRPVEELGGVHTLKLIHLPGSRPSA